MTAAGNATAKPTTIPEYPGGYTGVPNWISLEPRLSRDAKALLTGLLNNEFRKTTAGYEPPVQTVFALWIGSNKPDRRGRYLACKQTIREAEAELERWGLVRVERRTRARSVYTVNKAALMAGSLTDLGTGGSHDLGTSGSQNRGNLGTGGSTIKTTVRPAPKNSSPSAKPSLISSGAAEETRSSSGHEDEPEANVIDDPTMSWPEPVRKRLFEHFHDGLDLLLHLARTRTWEQLVAEVPALAHEAV